MSNYFIVSVLYIHQPRIFSYYLTDWHIGRLVGYTFHVENHTFSEVDRSAVTTAALLTHMKLKEDGHGDRSPIAVKPPAQAPGVSTDHATDAYEPSTSQEGAQCSNNAYVNCENGEFTKGRRLQHMRQANCRYDQP